MGDRDIDGGGNEGRRKRQREGGSDLNMGHLGFLSKLQEPLPLPKLIYSQVFMINQCRIKYVLENKVYAYVCFRTV